MHCVIEHYGKPQSYHNDDNLLNENNIHNISNVT